MKASQDFIKRIKDAVECHQQGRLDQAARQYKAILAQWPNHPDALHLLGVVSLQQGNAERAIRLIERAIHIDPSPPVFHSNLANAYHESGRRKAAEKSYADALKRDSHFVDALLGLGNTLAAENRHAEAIDFFEKALDLRPDDANAHFFMGNVRKVMGGENLKIAARCYQHAIELDPNHQQARIQLGGCYLAESCWEKALAIFEPMLRTDPPYPEGCLGAGHAWFGMGDMTHAIATYRRVIRLWPGEIDAWHNLGIAYRKTGDLDQSEACFWKVVDLDPKRIGVYLHLGNLYEEHRMSTRAIATYEQALVIDPENYKILNNLGTVLLHDGQIDAAIAAFKRALLSRPDYPECLYNLGNALLKAVRPAEALSSYEKVLKAKPALKGLHNGIANACRALERFDEAMAHYHKAIERYPEDIETWQNMSALYAETGQTEEAVRCFDEILKKRPSFGTEVKRAMLVPLFYDSIEAIDRARSDFEQRLGRLLANPQGRLVDPYREVRVTNFNLALHGRNDRHLRQKIARFYLKSCPELGWTAPGIEGYKKSEEKIKIGLVSRYFHSHTIGHLYRGIISQLSKSRFHVVLFRIGGQTDDVSREINRVADEVVALPENLHESRQRIASHALDLLFYPEIGMDAFTYYLAFSRLAPVQVKRGFPVTSGIPTIDYFLSSELFEPPNAQEHYTEKLIRLKRTGYYYRRPLIEKPIVNRGMHGLPVHGKLYVCLQSLFKLHPEVDDLLARILRKDPHGHLVLLGGRYRHWRERWCQRFFRRNRDLSERIVFLPPLSRDQFISVFMIADAVLDSIHFSGGNTSLECFANHVPVITWPSDFMRGRLTDGYYRMMGIDDCIATNHDDYVALAIRLANDNAWKASLRHRLEMNASVLFDDLESVRELESVFAWMVDQHRRS